MVEKTIEVEKTITEEESVTICNDCGREVDEDGMTYYGNDEELHFCSECRNRFVEKDVQAEVFEEVDDWLDHDSEWTNSVRENVNLMKRSAVFFFYTGLALGIGLLLASVFATVQTWMLVLYGIGGLGAVLSLNIDADNVRGSIKRADDAVFNE